MPARHDRSAPVFKNTNDLPGYLDELERLFSEHGITGEREMINASLRYLPYNESRVWKLVGAFTDQTKTWAEFKEEVIKLYPGAAIEGQTTRGDLEALVTARAASVIATRAELGEYNRRFKVLADDLLRKHGGKIFSDNEANYAYLRGFAAGELRKSLIMRLTLTIPDHDSELAYDRAKVFSEADAILSGHHHDHPSAHRLQKLRVLRPLISNQLEAECVIDSGSEGVMMRKDIWAAIGLPLYLDDTISITAANSTSTRTLGGLRNVLFNIGGMEVYLQVQVIEDAPWEVLLGRSFFTHTACVTKDSPDGSSVLTLTHPETGERVLVPTLERPARHSPRKQQGFP
ncbi:hypothetical protein PUNSTDRAFT_63034 [Punctularia strigosozonata HHB-11173 SS5]|uniref:uncharacterized protein n=1 Tax=Punctularia strigosozonata (strain HHB-11173) TaxID=741275 RepID=UPI00044184CD|nr:uncharacterized protein PUNSTDRAFT_63034 [Punctularia strigosozonata HHB-11173 SS5]EIN11612.1 hypothetical protein PUNSTDRAFT_63034 [Punctularia strigosozonata HHB-11173 SS5]